MEQQRVFGEEIERLRKERGLNQGDLARLVGLDQSYLSRIERGQYAPPSNMKIIALADALSTDRQSLFALAGRTVEDLVHTEGDQMVQVKAAVRSLLPLGSRSLRIITAMVELLEVVNRMAAGSHEVRADREALTAAYHRFEKEAEGVDSKTCNELLDSVMSMVGRKTGVVL